MSQERLFAWRARAALALPLLYMGGIYYLSAQTGISLPWRISDKLLHGIEYAGLSLTLYGSFAIGLSQPPLRSAALAIGFSLLYGVTDELHQAFVPGRHPCVYDLMADAVGAVTGQVIVLLLRLARYLARRLLR
jgi:VanZ family protein